MKLERRYGIKDHQSSLQDYMKITEIKGKRANLESRISEIILRTQEEIEKNKRDIEDTEIKLRQLKFNRQYCKLRLRELYHRVLGSVDDAIILGKPYYQIIQALWDIKEVVAHDHFPKFIDQESIKFLLEVTPTTND